MLTLALQTDSRGVTAVLADRPKGGSVRLAGYATVERAPSADKLAEALRAALPKLRGGKAQLAVALGPEDVRVKRLAVPPAPETELPPIVALQAARDAAADVESIVADFSPPQAGQEGAPTVLAAWASEEALAFWREVAEDLGGRLAVATPRPLAIAPSTGEGEPVIFLARAGDSIDFVSFAANQPVLVRSAHVGEADAQRELRRTLLALSADGVEAPKVLPLHDDLIPGEDIAHSMWPETSAADLIDATAYDKCLAATGLAILTARGDKPTINLADPRRPPVAETGRRRQVLLGAAAASVIAAAAWLAYDRVAQLDRQISEKQKEIAAAEADVEAFEPYQSKVAEIEEWRQSDVNWLDELDRLSQKLRPAPLDAKDFPVASDIRATQLIATAMLGGNEPGGRIDLTAVARSSSSSELEARLRDGNHPVEPISTTETPAKDEYRYKYTALLRVPPDTGVVADEEPADESVNEDVEGAGEVESSAGDTDGQETGAAPVESVEGSLDEEPVAKPDEAAPSEQTNEPTEDAPAEVASDSEEASS
ncbi:hypothetical protein [Botrimarina mediterranea]|uniref:hypothetical protein n=1 Tax=Botrimarina mediterranea TaxID=2528022 RepID=UPI0011885BFD|nr:hypothetical protein K2D_18230 [Planctomycetes bacterium K2D]